MFEIHSQLLDDCIVVGSFPLCQLLLMNDANYPWFILVPRREDIIELHQLSDADQQQLMQESSLFSKFIEKEFNADKLNVAALGNVVPQLHIHHVVRYKDDIAWPAPIWGKHDAKKYSDEQLQAMIKRLNESLGKIEVIKFVSE